MYTNPSGVSRENSFGSREPSAVGIQQLTQCTKQRHIQKHLYNCQRPNCNLKPLLCDECAFTSSDFQAVKMCKLCHVSDHMKDFDPGQQIDELNSEHKIKLVASVSYDRNKKQFNYDKFNPANLVGDAQAYSDVQDRQDATIEQAKIKFEKADKKNNAGSNNSGSNNSGSSLGSQMLESQDSVAEQFNKIRFSKKNPSNLYKVHKKFGDKLYLARRKTDSVLFMIKSVTESYLEEEVKEESF